MNDIVSKEHSLKIQNNKILIKENIIFVYSDYYSLYLDNNSRLHLRNRSIIKNIDRCTISY